ncbi:hypothetical protein VNO77_34979 [Canavalia gladiata]|uniref:Uncharacterized protein n=1 Tax=Canavalia gladiata TaxID=3824 RepID=A0AAN9PYT2_CANGL
MVPNARRCLPLELSLHLVSPISFCLGCYLPKGLGVGHMIECCISSLALCLHDEHSYHTLDLESMAIGWLTCTQSMKGKGCEVRLFSRCSGQASADKVVTKCLIAEEILDKMPPEFPCNFSVLESQSL